MSRVYSEKAHASARSWCQDIDIRRYPEKYKLAYYRALNIAQDKIDRASGKKKEEKVRNFDNKRIKEELYHLLDENFGIDRNINRESISEFVIDFYKKQRQILAKEKADAKAKAIQENREEIERMHDEIKQEAVDAAQRFKESNPETKDKAVKRQLDDYVYSTTTVGKIKENIKPVPVSIEENIKIARDLVLKIEISSDNMLYINAINQIIGRFDKGGTINSYDNMSLLEYISKVKKMCSK